MLREQDLKSGAAWNLSRAQSLAPENITNWSVFAWDPVKETPRAATSTSLASWNRDWQIGILYQNDGVCPERTFIVCSFPFPPTYAKHICLSSVILPIVRLLNTTHIRHGVWRVWHTKSSGHHIYMKVALFSTGSVSNGSYLPCTEVCHVAHHPFV